MLLAELLPGRVPTDLSALRVAHLLRQVRSPAGPQRTRRDLAREVLLEVRTLDRGIGGLDQQLKAALAASHTTLQQLHGIGPVLAAILLGRIGDITRFPTTGHFAAYCGVAPIEASSGAVIRHRLSRAVDRQLNAALHMMAVTQAGSHPLGRAYYLRKQTEGHSKADVVYRRVRRDAISEQVAPATDQAISV